MFDRSRRSLVSVLTALVLVPAVGCSAQSGAVDTTGSDGRRPRAQADAPAASPSASRSPRPKPRATQQGQPAGTRSAATTGKVNLKDRLLTAEQLPAFDDRFAWVTATTRVREGDRPFATCHKFAMTSIGATEVAVRAFVSGSDDSEAVAGHLVAGFADEPTATRAFEVLRSWHDRCAEELGGYDHARVGRFQSAGLPAEAVGGWYLLTYGPAAGTAEEDYLDAQGIARAGSRIAVVQLRVTGRDGSHPGGTDPLAGVMGAAAEKLG